MSCCESCLQGCCSAPTSRTTTICSSDICCRPVCLPSTYPHKISLLGPICSDSCSPPCCMPDSYVASCWLLRNCQSTPNLSGISITTDVLPCPCEPPC